jgi:hypothetical protein
MSFYYYTEWGRGLDCRGNSRGGGELNQQDANSANTACANGQ